MSTKTKSSSLSIPRDMMNAWKRWEHVNDLAPGGVKHALYAWMRMGDVERYRWRGEYRRWRDGEVPSIRPRGGVPIAPALGLEFSDEDEEYLRSLQAELDSEFSGGEWPDDQPRTPAEWRDFYIKRISAELLFAPLSFVAAVYKELEKTRARRWQGPPEKVDESNAASWPIQKMLADRIRAHSAEKMTDEEDVVNAAVLMYLEADTNTQDFARIVFSKFDDDHDDEGAAAA